MASDRRQWHAEHLLVLQRLRRQGLRKKGRPPRYHGCPRRNARRHLLAAAGRACLHAQCPALGANRGSGMLRDRAEEFWVTKREVAANVASYITLHESSPRKRGPITTGICCYRRRLPPVPKRDITRYESRRSPGRRLETMASRSTRPSWPGFPDRYGPWPHPSAHR